MANHGTAPAADRPHASNGSTARRNGLRDFLRTRRARLSPEDVGMPAAGRRRTPGLRREEVAVLAGVGVSWYTWLEQGRDINVSAEVLDAVARALRLSEPERQHLYRLAGLNPPQVRPAAPRLPVEPSLQRLLDGWSPKPAYVLDRHWYFIATNAAAREIFGLTSRDHNCLIAFFTNDRYRGAVRNWAEMAPQVVGQFRHDAGRHPDDPAFARLAERVSAVSPEFAELWARHDVSPVAQGIKALRHPEAGELTFEYTSLPLPHRPDDRLLLHNPAPGTGTAARLERWMAAVETARPDASPAGERAEAG
ncbi:helix-turn-helix transcriptional regulator [Allostreptomyces psammosilenae]|uniref:Transcriptional regulator with XRE-family HTH domain n=1 Tax=Allostreptomyces psammosilenae TaxID=1892865 RepID=A0A852ZX39_9ACTN|nr:helix-turn-helix transcriptional regulator [Allostreptomyces psammosilenae]NYI06926.1 transcriptional regulator with XRE-family HTH domain [Allostreptomyces psammosilenae]